MPKEYYTVPEIADILNVSRISIYRKVKKGEIRATMVGKTYIVHSKDLAEILGRKITRKEQELVDSAVKMSIKEYGKVFKLLAQE